MSEETKHNVVQQKNIYKICSVNPNWMLKLSWGQKQTPVVLLWCRTGTRILRSCNWLTYCAERQSRVCFLNQPSDGRCGWRSRVLWLGRLSGRWVLNWTQSEVLLCVCAGRTGPANDRRSGQPQWHRRDGRWPHHPAPPADACWYALSNWPAGRRCTTRTRTHTQSSTCIISLVSGEEKITLWF